jgi:hypothetical protein
LSSSDQQFGHRSPSATAAALPVSAIAAPVIGAAAGLRGAGGEGEDADECGRAGASSTGSPRSRI